MDYSQPNLLFKFILAYIIAMFKKRVNRSVVEFSKPKVYLL